MNQKMEKQLSDRTPKAPEAHQKNNKTKLQEGIVVMALLVIFVALLVIPKYRAYGASKAELEKRVRYYQELPDQMTEETYLKKLGEMSEALKITNDSLPESLDTVSLYEAVAKTADTAEVGLTSLEFGLIKFQIDDPLGARIAPEFTENEEKTIQGPDGKFLATCEFTVVCTGNDETFMAFLDRLNQSIPVIRVISYEIKKGSGSEKQMHLRLESYGVVQNKQDNQRTEKTYQPQEMLAP